MMESDSGFVFTDVRQEVGVGIIILHNYVVWSKNIKEGWSEPVYLNSTGFDPSLFHEKDGKMYLVNMINGFEGIQIQEFDKEQMCLIKEPVNVCRGTGRDLRKVLICITSGNGIT
mgnify:CR=1 FL=1